MRNSIFGSLLWALGLGFGSGDAQAQPPTHLWPGVAPCAGTLQACINAAAADDVVQIVTNTPVAEDLSLTRSIALEGGIGYSARLAAGFRISGGSVGSDNFAVAIRRLGLTGGGITLTHNSTGMANIEIRHVAIDAPVPALNAWIFVQINGAGAATVRITDNRVRSAGSDTGGGAGVGVVFVGNSGTALLDFNHIEGLGSGPNVGILGQAASGGVPSIAIVNNEVRGRYAVAGIAVVDGGPPTTTVTANVLGNVLVSRNEFGVGILEQAQNGGVINTKVRNNTTVGWTQGIELTRNFGGTGTISGSALNNLVAYNEFGLYVDDLFLANISQDYNLLWANFSNFYTPGPHDVTADPKLRSLTDVRVQAGSPAISAGNGFVGTDFVDSGVGLVDADGLRRLKGPLDIGAYEFGDFSFLARATAPISQLFYLNQPLVDGNPVASLFATVNAGATDAPPFITDYDPTGVYYDAGLWSLFNENLAPMPTDVEFNVFAPQTGNGAFVHIVTPSSIFFTASVIDLADLNGHPEKILLALSNWNPPGSPGVYNPHNISVSYGGSMWAVYNQNFSDGAWAAGAAVNIYAQDPSPNAYRHTATTANSIGNLTLLDHPLLNATPCAQVNVTSANGTDTAFDVSYDVGLQRWRIYNLQLPMADLAQFAIVIDPAQVAACAGVLMSDGFED